MLEDERIDEIVLHILKNEIDVADKADIIKVLIQSKSVCMRPTIDYPTAPYDPTKAVPYEPMKVWYSAPPVECNNRDTQ